MATCEGFPPAVGSFNPVASEADLPPRQRKKSGCADCHNEGGVDPMARFFMGYAGSRVLEVDGNHNFQGDPYNFYGTHSFQPNEPRQWLPDRPVGLLNFGYLPEQMIAELNPGTYYGRGLDGINPDSWKGRKVTDGLRALADVLVEDKKFIGCLVRRAWQLTLSRNPASVEEMQVTKITEKLAQKRSVTLLDAVKAVVLSDAFRKDN